MAKTIDDYYVASLIGVPIIEDGYTLVDMQVSYTYALSAGEEVVLNFVGKNLTDEEYVEQELPLGTQGGFRGWGAPRTYAFEVLWKH
jgi:outer membrane receptor protein involved in Fe transport